MGYIEISEAKSHVQISRNLLKKQVRVTPIAYFLSC